MSTQKAFEIKPKELDELKVKSEKFWEVIRQCHFNTPDEKQKAWREIGLSPTPKTVIYTENTMTLNYCLPPAGVEPTTDPILIIPSLINKNYTMDLIKGHSLLEYLNNAGVPCYIIDWGIPGEEHGSLTFDDFIDGLIRRAAVRVMRHAKASGYHVLGQCIGGILATVYAAKYAKTGKIRSLINLTTPFDFEKGGKLVQWTKPRTFNLDKFVNAYKIQGALPPEVVHAGFPFLDLSIMFGKYRNLFNFGSNSEFVRLYRALDFWANDNIPFPCEVFRKFVRDFYQENKLIKGELIIGDERVTLEGLTMPVFSVLAQFDHVFPAEAAQNWRKKPHPGDKETVYMGGHVNILAGLPVRFQVFEDIRGFITENN